MRQREMGGVKRAEEVGAHDLFQRFQRAILEILPQRHARRVDEDVKPAEGLFRFGEEALV